MSTLFTKLNTIYEESLSSIQKADSLERINAIDDQLFNRKKGSLNLLLRDLKDITDPSEKKEVGMQANEVKKQLLSALDDRKSKFTATQRGLSDFDATLPAIGSTMGHAHPLRQIQEDLVSVFHSMGFDVHEGNELENELYCFEYLNIPPTHPARDLQDTFYIKQRDSQGEQQVLRTHTSNMQVRILENSTPPVKAIVPGRVFRNEAIDATHEHTFYQLEGIVVDEDISIANLTYFLKLAMAKVLQRDVKIRLRPGYFPYVEPGFEVDVYTPEMGWVEMLGCGMIHPKVFESAGYEEGKYTGFAFGIGLNRMAQMKYSIPDARLFMGGDLRFIQQF